jgi:folate-dependent phosphoribosylglycinamide formyltransferase PurN
MRIGLTTGPLPHHKFFIQRFYEEFGEDLICCINQRRPKSFKKRNFKEKTIHSFLHLSDWNATQSYFLNRKYRHIYKQLLEQINFPDYIEHEVDDINSYEAEEILKNSNVDILVVFGGGIINEQMLVLPKLEAYTLHLGWCPDYKGSHCLHWAIHNEDYNKLGISILTLRKQIDSGEIVLRKKIDLTNINDEYDLTLNAQKLAIEEMIKVIRNLNKTGKLPITKKQTGKGKIFYASGYTPKIKGMVRRRMKSLIRKNQNSS